MSNLSGVSYVLNSDTAPPTSPGPLAAIVIRGVLDDRPERDGDPRDE
jgi:hypothetical protein